MGGFIHISVIVHHPLRCHNSVWIIQLVLILVLHLVFHMVMLKMVWVLGPPKCSPKNMIFGLMVVVLCHIWVGIIQPWSITTNTDTIIYYIIKGRINFSLLVMVEVVFVEKQHTSTPLRVNLFRDRNYWGLIIKGDICCIPHIFWCTIGNNTTHSSSWTLGWTSSYPPAPGTI